MSATGGSLKPTKCSYFPISFRWKANGTWMYENNILRPNLSIGVPLADGSLAEIEHLSVSSIVKTLWSMTCPTGRSTAALGWMQQKDQEWEDQIKSGKQGAVMCGLWWTINFCLVWGMVSARTQSPAMNWNIVFKGYTGNLYYLGVECMGQQHFSLQQLDHGFYGIGCPLPEVECLVAQITKLLIHY